MPGRPVVHFSMLKKLLQLEKGVHILIFLNLGAYALETVKELSPYFSYFDRFEYISLILFTIEYLIRVTVSFLKGKARQYIFSFMGLIDFISILPIFIPFTRLDLRFVRILRLFQVFRIFKLYRYYEHLQMIVTVIKYKKEDLIATLFSIALVLIFCSCVTFYFEKDVQPESFNNIFSAMYWGISTITTIGYGDIFPKTPGGKFMAAVLSLLGIGLVAMPAGILSAGFIEVNARKREIRQKMKGSNKTEGGDI
jgi:voltage-gated potassium channel